MINVHDDCVNALAWLLSKHATMKAKAVAVDPIRNNMVDLARCCYRRQVQNFMKDFWCERIFDLW